MQQVSDKRLSDSAEYSRHECSKSSISRVFRVSPPNRFPSHDDFQESQSTVVGPFNDQSRPTEDPRRLKVFQVKKWRFLKQNEGSTKYEHTFDNF